MLSRRSMFSLLGLAALPVAAQVQAKPAPKQTFIKGMVVPRIREYVVPDYSAQMPSHSHSYNPAFNAGHSHGYTPARVVREVEYQIFDGEKFVALESESGQRVIADLS
jgi:hypothetical protein